MNSLPRLFSSLAATLVLIAPLRAGDPLEAVFTNPPAGAHPHTWWHWNNGNVSKEGITLDLEAMKRIGVTGAQIFNVKQCDLTGPVVTGSPEWLALTEHAIKEAQRLGMELTIHNCPGWSESGGPWITPEQSMQKVVWTETRVKGGEHFSGTLSRPEAVKDYYRDIALLAFPSPPDEEALLATARTFAAGGADGALTPVAPDAKTPAKLEFGAAKDRRFVQAGFAAPVKVSSIQLKGSGDKIPLEASVEASDDGKIFRRLAALTIKGPFSSASFEFPETTARFFRIAFSSTGPKPGKIAISTIDFSGPRIPNIEARAGYHPDPNLKFSDKPLPAEACIDRSRIIDLTAKLNADGRLDWDVPAGNWTLLRLGHTSTGKTNAPAPATRSGPRPRSTTRRSAT